MTASDFFALWFLATFAAICFTWRRWVIRERTEARRFDAYRHPCGGRYVAPDELDDANLAAALDAWGAEQA
jgi:hypothetical protein